MKCFGCKYYRYQGEDRRGSIYMCEYGCGIGEEDEKNMPCYGNWEPEDPYTPSASAGDYSPSNPWDAPGMSVSDFI